MKNNPYIILGLEPGISPEELKRAYRRSLLSVHPDHNPRDPEAKAKTQAVIDAYRYLSDPVRRAALDQKLENEARQRSHQYARDPREQRRRTAPRRKNSSQRSAQKRGRPQGVNNTVIINGKIVELDANGCIDVVTGNSRIHVQQSVSSSHSYDSKNVKIQMNSARETLNGLAEQIDAMIARIMAGYD